MHHIKKVLKIGSSKKAESGNTPKATTSASSTPQPATTTAAAPAATNMSCTTAAQYIAGFKVRHSVYGVKNTSKVSDAQLQKYVEEVLDNYPNAYNYQPARVALLLGEQHSKFWETVIATAEGPLTAAMGEDGWNGFKGRLEGFKAAYGTAAFYDEEKTIDQQKSDHKHIAGLFPQWADHANGMAQHMLWVTLALEGIGGSLQHLNLVPGVQQAVAKEFGISDTWTLKAQLVFGDPAGEWPAQKEKLPKETTLKVFK